MPTPTPGLWKCANGEIVEIVGRAKAGAYPWVSSANRGRGALAYSDEGTTEILDTWNLVEPCREPAKKSVVVYLYRGDSGDEFPWLNREHFKATPIGSARVEVVEGVFVEGTK